MCDFQFYEIIEKYFLLNVFSYGKNCTFAAEKWQSGRMRRS